MIVWKHHIAEHFEKDPSLIKGNGVGTGGTIFRDFDGMKNWLSQHDKRRFYVAPINVREEQLMPTEDENVDASLMANARETIFAIGPFAPIEHWEKQRHSLQASSWYNRYKTASEPVLGYKIVGWNGQRAYSLYRTTLTYDVRPGVVHYNLYLGTSEQFCLDYYTGGTNDRDMLLTYTYLPEDIISGGGQNSEVQVKKATLQSSRVLEE